MLLELKPTFQPQPQPAWKWQQQCLPPGAPVPLPEGEACAEVEDAELGCDQTRVYLTFLLQFDPLVGGRPSIMVRMGITHFALRSHSQHFLGSSQYGSIQGRDGWHRGGGGGDGVRGSYCYEQVRSLASWSCLVPILPLKNVGIFYQTGKKPENFVSYTC